ncbi:hypothetical protein NMY22_g8679 [Coprinellus aureogranulatus]|nr:hypothetical protein NMY22_g8679 [Coprinellus aureogranulatus]
MTGRPATKKEIMSVIKVGDTIPEGTFKYIPWSDALEDNLVCGVPVELSTNEWKGKKVVLVSVPGAFTVCLILSSHDQALANGIPPIRSLRRFDFAILHTSLAAGSPPSEHANTHTTQIIALSDNGAQWSKKIGLDKDLTANGLGIRTTRYALILEDNVVKYIGVETAPGVSVSGADAVLAAL